MIAGPQRDMLLEIAAECEARAEKATADMLAHRRRMLHLRQRAALLREMAGAGEAPREPPDAP